MEPIVVDPDPGWPAAYEAEAARLRDVWGTTCCASSTSAARRRPGHRLVFLSHTSELARAAAAQGRSAEARAALLELLEDRRRVLGDEHPVTRGTLDVLADVQRERAGGPASG